MKRKGYRVEPTRDPGIYRTPKTRIFPNRGWEVRYRDPDNATLRKTFATRQQALDFQADVRSKKRAGDWINPQKAKTPFKDVAKAWYETTADLKPSTRRSYRLILDAHILLALGDKPIGRIEPSTLRAFFAELPERLSPKTKRNIGLVLSPIFKQAVEDKMIPSSPLRRGLMPKVSRPEMRKLKAEQVAELAAVVRAEYRCLIYFAAYTGARAGEIAALRVKDLDLLRGQVTVRRSLSRVNGEDHWLPPKNGEVRSFGVPGFLVELLAAHLADRPHTPNDLVFTGEQGGPFRHANFYNRHFKPAVRRLVESGTWADGDLANLRFHDLRHTCASMLIAANVHAKAISERLGHSSIAITMDRYGHLYKEHQAEIADKLEATFKKAAAVGAVPARSGEVTPIR